MRTAVFATLSFALAAFVATPPASADYETHPELRPEARCSMIPAGLGSPKDPGGVASHHCQPLFWDLPAATKLGFVAAAAPDPRRPPPHYPGGLTDRPPPLFILDANGDGRSDDGEGYEVPGEGRVRLCTDEHQVTWWRPKLDAAGAPVVGKDPTTGAEGPLHEVACRRGTRVRYGPWQAGTRTDVSDQLSRGVLRFENSDRLSADAKRGAIDPKTQGRVEWHLGSEMYGHVGTHHTICWTPVHPKCSNPDDPFSASNRELCWEGYQAAAEAPAADAPGGCWGGDQDISCNDFDPIGQEARGLMTGPGRYHFELPTGEAVIGLEDPLWVCDHHVVHRIVPGILGNRRLADYRQQLGGLPNTSGVAFGTAAPGEVIGGAVGELVLQYFAAPRDDDRYSEVRFRSLVRTGGLGTFLTRVTKGGKTVFGPSVESPQQPERAWPPAEAVARLPDHGLADPSALDDEP